MANAQLIQMAKDLGASKGFVDVGAAFEQSFMRWYGEAKEKQEKDEIKKKEGDEITRKYIEKMGGADLPKLPQYMQEKASKWAKDLQLEYAEHASAIGDMDVKDPEYAHHVGQMNNINNSIESMNNTLELLKEDKTKYLALKGKGDTPDLLSNAVSVEDRALLDRIYTDNTSVEIDKQGGLTFVLEDGKKIKKEDLPRTIKRDNTIAVAVAGLNDKYIKLGAEAGDTMVKTDVEALLRSASDDQIRSWAADGIIDDPTPSPMQIPKEWYSDPTKVGKIRQQLGEYLVETLKEASQEGNKMLQSRTRATTRPSTKTYRPPYSLDPMIFPDEDDVDNL